MPESAPSQAERTFEGGHARMLAHLKGRCRIKAVGLRATVASIVAVMLLSLSCIAGVCDVSCELTSLGQSCHGHNNLRVDQHVRMPNTGMQHCGMDVDHGNKTDVTLRPRFSSCSQHAFTQQPVLLNEKRGTVSHLSLNQSAEGSAVTVAPRALGWQAPFAGISPQRASLFVPRHTVLRI